MDRDPCIDRLQQELLLLPNSKLVSTPTELASVRCPLCGDSGHADSSHLYIGTKVFNGVTRLVYDCKLCSSSGLVTPTLLRKLNVYDIQVEEYIKKTQSSGYMKTFSQDDDTSSIVYKYVRPTKEDAYKVDYVSKRLNIDFNDFENIKKYRLVINLMKFLELNHINKPQVAKRTVQQIDEAGGVGFVSFDKSSISMRVINYAEYGVSRFNIIHLYQNIRRTYSYIPPCAVDVLSPMPHIAVSESNFNIINIQNYFYGQDNPNVILGSSSRKGCAKAIMNLITKSGFTGGKLDVYADNDSTFKLDYFEQVLAPFMPTFDITIILNTDEKDFGEPPKDGIYHYKKIKI